MAVKGILKFVTPSWDEIYSKSISLAKKLRKEERSPFESLVGVSRGGLVPVRILSDLLDIHDVNIIKCEYYSGLGETNRKPEITQKIQGDISGRSILVVDDVADTGESLVEIMKYLKSRKPRSIKIATLYMKPWSKVLPDYYVSKTDSWIIFPWELYETIKLFSKKEIKTGVVAAHVPRKYTRMIFKMDEKLNRVRGHI